MDIKPPRSGFAWLDARNRRKNKKMKKTLAFCKNLLYNISRVKEK
jgi:hypothetical protein